jgi:hypothetical protein
MSFFVRESFKLTIRKDWRGKPAKIKIMPRHRHCISSSLRNDLRKTRETKQKKKLFEILNESDRVHKNVLF